MLEVNGESLHANLKDYHALSRGKVCPTTIGIGVDMEVFFQTPLSNSGGTDRLVLSSYFYRRDYD